MTITIRHQILAGNLGDGWLDNNDTAHVFAGYICAYMEQYLDAMEFTEITLDIEVLENCSGLASIDWEIEHTYHSKLYLPTAKDLWEKFCNTDLAYTISKEI
jgi:hypothetical protein